MPWWSWVLIWLFLVLLLVGTVAFLGWRLFKKAMRAMDALGELGDKTALLSDASRDLEPEVFVPSILRPLDDVREDVLSRRRRSAERKHLRRENRLARGRVLVSADLRGQKFPWESSATRLPDGT